MGLVAPFVARRIVSVRTPFFGLKVWVHEMCRVEMRANFIRSRKAASDAVSLTCGIWRSERVVPACQSQSQVPVHTLMGERDPLFRYLMGWLDQR
jgi:hypothetical protein